MRIIYVKKLRVVFIALLVFGILAVYFRPRPLHDVLKAAEVNPDSTVYCTLFDVTEGYSRNWSDSAAVFFDPSNELFWPFMNEISVAGPVFYKASSVNSDLVNLYFSLPQDDGTYRQVTVELILRRREVDFQKYDAFINIGNSGYFVISGGNVMDSFIQKVRDIPS